MIEQIKEFDTNLFLWLNSIHSPAMDSFFFAITNRFVWIPVYLILLFLLIKKKKNKTWSILLFIVILIICSDQLSVLIKENVMRYRPCHNLNIQGVVHTVNNKCGGKYGFVSSHATNTMALFAFLVLSVFKKERIVIALLAIYVLLVSYSRVYLGVHYPFDILGGWITGLAVALVLYYFVYNKLFNQP
ncbi:MAG TPA: phosphatase PAP2 family protein [Bacteroidia bacterium]|nr:phosphatase PAP2 family protein [Bacteroidia bacterium]QQR94749.1 MAG: phosphatase PAP2 family protein [Bacteroidota bacterium]HRB96893.1 phosphatase PAP2 family protein [Nitrosomonas sp.]MBP7715230.1 phosphatase PAP2 family protein [Bacteroidia bacterium]MBP8669388.1 phosphatase PAP2 family protein [Bacteroidia bacterium]